MKSDEFFTMYEKYKGHEEDAYPYVDIDTMIVADGLGGAGLTLHDSIPASAIDSIEKIMTLVLPEDKNGVYKDYVYTQFEEVIHDPKISRKSAYLASRIVVSRYLYAVKKYKENTNEITKFVLSGMQRFADMFSLDVTGNGLYLLPSTLVSASVLEETNEELTVRIIWAGDSRAFLLNENGLQPISKDDEDYEGGAMNNLFALKVKTVHLNAKEYTFKKPCCLVLSSDGIFDNRAACNVEHVLLDGIFYGKSMEGYRSLMERYYNKYKKDDCSIAFRMFGYSSFDSLMESLEDRYEYINDLDTKVTKNNQMLEIVRDTQGNINNVEQLVNRIKSRKDIIISKLVDTVAMNQPDLALPKSCYVKVVRENHAKVLDEVVSSIRLANGGYDLSIPLDSIFDLSNGVFDKMKLRSKLDGYKKYKECKEARDRRSYLIEERKSLLEEMKEAYDERAEGYLLSLNEEITRLGKLYTLDKLRGYVDKVESLLIQLSSVAYANELYDALLDSAKMVYSSRVSEEGVSLRKEEIVKNITTLLSTDEGIHELLNERCFMGKNMGSVLDSVLNKNVLNDVILYKTYEKYGNKELDSIVEMENKYNKQISKYLED